MSSRLLSMLAAMALAAAAQPATAAPAAADEDAAFGVLQQGKGQGGGQGGGGGQDARGGGRGQGGGGGQEARGGGRGQGGGGGQARESRGRGNSGGGDDARPSRQDGGGQSSRGNGNAQSSRGSSGSGGGSARADNRGRSSDDVRSESRGRGSDDARESRGNSGNASARSDDWASNVSATGSARRSANAAEDRLPATRTRGRLSEGDLRSRLAALPQAQRRLANSSRTSERMAVGAIARGAARGLPVNAFDVRSDNDRVRILNRRGDLLFDMDDRRADELGGWRLRRLGDQSPRSNAPAFCRNGEGHPVWGREWCIEKGFGLGSRAGTIWSRGGIGDVIFRDPDYRTRLDRGGLLGVLGDIVLGRLALQSMALGYDEPLTGYWVADPSGPYLLRVNSGPYEVAEFYDRDRDNRAEVLYVVQPVW